MMLMCLLMLVMLIARAFAGTYVEEGQESESVPNYPDTTELVEKPEQVYTRTIIRPVSYSFISANVQPRVHKVTEETATFITERVNNEKLSSEQSKPETRKMFLSRRTVLPGNFDDLQHSDYILLGQTTEAPKSEETEPRQVSPVVRNLNDAAPTQIVVASSPKSKLKRPLPQFHTRRPQIHEVYERPGRRRIGSEIYLGRGRPVQHLRPIPEVNLQPPPLKSHFQQKLTNHGPAISPVKDVGTSKSTDSKIFAHPVEEKSSNNVPRLNHAPTTHEEITHPNEEAEELEEENTDDDSNYENVLPQPPKQDQKESESEHKEEAKKKKKEKKESSEGSEHEEHSESKKGEKGEKGYKKSSKHDKAGKGHHDEESHKGEYVEEHGEEKKHHKGEGFYGEHKKEEKGKKAKKYGEGKNHKKGHSTHGEHNIVKKNEYIKSTKFYDEDHDDGEAEEHSEYHGLHSEKEGGKKEGGHKKKGYHKDGKAKKGHHDKGHHEEEHGGFEKDEGGEDFHGHEESFSGKKGEKHSKKWKKE